MKGACTVEPMKNTPEAERLAKAINSLARVIADIRRMELEKLLEAIAVCSYLQKRIFAASLFRVSATAIDRQCS